MRLQELTGFNSIKSLIMKGFYNMKIINFDSNWAEKHSLSSGGERELKFISTFIEFSIVSINI